MIGNHERRKSEAIGEYPSLQATILIFHFFSPFFIKFQHPNRGIKLALSLTASTPPQPGKESYGTEKMGESVQMSQLWIRCPLDRLSVLCLWSKSEGKGTIHRDLHGPTEYNVRSHRAEKIPSISRPGQGHSQYALQGGVDRPLSERGETQDGTPSISRRNGSSGFRHQRHSNSS